MSDCFMYCGRMVPKEGFRAYVYSPNDEKKLVNSYKEFEQSISSGIWFPVKPEKPVVVEETPKPVVEVAKPKRKRRA